jgi:hypothetical protein
VIIPNENGHLLRQWFRQHGIGISLALDVWFRAAAVVTPLDDRKVVIYTVANNFTEDAVGRMLDFLEKERIQEQNGLKLREEPEMEWDFWGDSDNSEDDNDGSLRVGESITSIDGRNFCIRARLA